MKIWTAHEKPHAAPVMVREGFSFGALFFGPIWLAAQSAWLAAAGALVAGVLILFLTNEPATSILMIGLAVLLGFSGRDLVRWTIARHGYLASSIVTGRNEDEAHARLLEARPDLIERAMVAERAP